MASQVIFASVQSMSASVPALPEHASAGQRWRFRRNLVISLASRNGVSQRILADVFDLPRSRIASIIKEFQAKYGQ